jgi:hypothetical protein
VRGKHRRVKAPPFFKGRWDVLVPRMDYVMKSEV